MFLFLVFTERHPIDSQVGRQFPLSAAPALFHAVIVTSISVLHFVIVLLVSVVITARFPEYMQNWANLLGLIAAGLACIQYIPQIWLTYKLGRTGSLSIPMMMVQTPGGYVFAWSLASRLGPEGWSAWFLYLVIATLQGVILVMSICFTVRERREAKEAESDEEERMIRDRNDGQFDDHPEDGWQHGRSNSNERAPLLGSSGHGRSATRASRRARQSSSDEFDPQNLIVSPTSPTPAQARKKSWSQTVKCNPS